MRTACLENETMITFGDWQETNQNEGILVGSSDVITDIPDREVDGMIFMLASCYGNSRFVASKYDGNKHCSVCINVFSDEVLFVAGLVDIWCSQQNQLTHCLQAQSPDIKSQYRRLSSSNSRYGA